MKKADYFGIGFLVLFALIVIFFPFKAVMGSISLKEFSISSAVEWDGFSCHGIKNFGGFTNAFPYLMGFFKFACLATFGEMLKNRMKTGSYHIDLFPVRVINWGLFGMIMTFAFALFAAGIKSLMGTRIWFGGNDFVFALSTSVWMNLIFAYPMMLAHEWCNVCMEKRGFVGGAAFFGGLNAQVWGSFIPKTILFFWIPAHTVTFLLPPEFRVLAGALLSTALGFILTLKAVHQK